MHRESSIHIKKILYRKEDKIAVIPNGIDPKRIYEIELEGGMASPGFEGKIHDNIFAGRLIMEKKIDFLLKSVVSLKLIFRKSDAALLGTGLRKKRFWSWQFVGMSNFQAFMSTVC